MNGERRTFVLAKMSRGVWWSTTLFTVLLGGVAVAVAVGVIGAGDELEREGIRPELALLFPVLIAAVFALVWCYYRPSGFEISEMGLTVRWPVRQRLHRGEDITSVRAVTKDEVGRPWRLWGAGGLWGLFGLCKCKHVGRLDVFISRGDGWVLIELADRRPLLISPETPEQVVEAMARIVQGAKDESDADIEGHHA